MLIEHLQKVFYERSQKTPQYSLRSFARSLEVDSSTLSALLRKKRTLTVRTAQHLIDRLGIENPEEVRALLLGCFTNVSEENIPACREMDLEMAEMMSSWEHFAILALLDLDKFEATTKNIALHLNIPFAVATDCVQRLKNLGLLAEESDVLKKTEKNLSTPSNIPSRKIRQGHRQFIEMGVEALETTAVEKRDISGVTMAINLQNLKGARARIQKFRREIAQYLEVGTKNSVYRLNIQLFPLDAKERQK